MQINLEDKVNQLISTTRKLVNTQLHSLKMLAALSEDLEHMGKAVAESREYFERTQVALTSNPIEVSQTGHLFPSEKITSLFESVLQSTQKTEDSQVPETTVIQDQASLLYLSQMCQLGSETVAPSPCLASSLSPESKNRLKAVLQNISLPSQTSAPNPFPIEREETVTQPYDLSSSSLYQPNQYALGSGILEPIDHRTYLNAPHISSFEHRIKDDEGETQPQLYCICRKPKSGRMITCKGQFCRLRLFHMACFKMNRIPKQPWYCYDCSNA